MDRDPLQRRILVIEDEDEIRDVIGYNLERAGYRVQGVADGRSGLDAARADTPRLIVLDVMLPELDGLELCRQLRGSAATVHVPILMLTARGDEEDIVRGLRIGADDYVTKPFSPRELVARVDALIRRHELPGASVVVEPDERTAVRVGDISVDPDRHEVLVDGAQVRLTPTELRLLHELLRSPGRVLTRSQLVERVLDGNAWVTERTIDVHVRAVRRKLGVRADVIETIRGVGYRGRPDGGREQ